MPYSARPRFCRVRYAAGRCGGTSEGDGISSVERLEESLVERTAIDHHQQLSVSLSDEDVALREVAQEPT